MTGGSVTPRSGASSHPSTSQPTKQGFAWAAEHVLFGVGKGIASTVYGTVVVMATLTAAYASEKDPWKLAAVVASTALVLWLAHVYAHGLAETITEGRLNLRDFPAVARREIGILLAAVLPVGALALGAIGVFGASAAVWLAFAIGLVTLAAEGLRYARLEGLGPGTTLAAVGVNLTLGLLVVALKVGISH